MGERFFETPKQFETPDNNVRAAALRLMRFKALCEMHKTNNEWVLSIQDVNEVLTVAGLPVIVPDEVQAKEVDVIKVEKEADYDNAE